MAQKRIPRLPQDDVYREVGLRCSMPVHMVKTVIKNYIEVVTQCLENQVAIPLGGMGSFVPMLEPPREYSESRSFLHGKPVVFFKKQSDGYIKFKFRPYKRYRDYITKNTIIHFGEMPSGDDHYAKYSDDLERIDYYEYMRQHHPERTEFQIDNDNSDYDELEEIEIAEEQDEYDMLFNEDDDE